MVDIETVMALLWPVRFNVSRLQIHLWIQSIVTTHVVLSLLVGQYFGCITVSDSAVARSEYVMIGSESSNRLLTWHPMLCSSQN
jgi:hypothetical protein